MEDNKFSDNWDPSYHLLKYLREWQSFTMIHSGMSRAGKSYSLRSMIEPIIKEFDFIIIFSKTITNGQYQKWCKTKLLFPEFRGEIVEKFKQISTKYRDKNKPKKFLFIIDDCISTNFKYQNEILELFVSGRHFGFSTCVLTQKVSCLSQAWLCNCLVFVILFAGSLKEKKYVSENILADALDSYIDHNKTSTNINELIRRSYTLIGEVCENYNSLIVLPLEKDKIFTYKAPPGL